VWPLLLCDGCLGDGCLGDDGAPGQLGVGCLGDDGAPGQLGAGCLGDDGAPGQLGVGCLGDGCLGDDGAPGQLGFLFGLDVPHGSVLTTSLQLGLEVVADFGRLPVLVLQEQPHLGLMLIPHVV